MVKMTFLSVIILLSGFSVSAGYAGTVSGKVSNIQHPSTMIIEEKNGERAFRVRTNVNGGYSIFLPIGSYTVRVNSIRCSEIRSFDVPVRRDIRCP